LWPDLLRAVWEAVKGIDPYSSDRRFLEQARRASLDHGLPQEFVRRLDVRRHPLEYQLSFETLYDDLRWSTARSAVRQRLRLRRPATRRTSRAPASNEKETAELFAQVLRKLLYRGQPRRYTLDTHATDTLSLVAQAVRQSALASLQQRRITQVITFNVDDVLEQVVNGKRGPTFRQKPLVWPVTRSNDVGYLADRKSIGIYHIHGFVPRSPAQYPFYSWDGGSMISDPDLPVESLVFTDEQYWQTVGNQGSLASRVVLQALSGSCVFIGLSMTDINILRWLSQNASEAKADYQRMASRWIDTDEVVFNAREELHRHYWITEKIDGDLNGRQSSSDLSAELLKDVLERRGVSSIEIPSWSSKAFHDWWKRCFLSA